MSPEAQTRYPNYKNRPKSQNQGRTLASACAAASLQRLRMLQRFSSHTTSAPPYASREGPAHAPYSVPANKRDKHSNKYEQRRKLYFILFYFIFYFFPLIIRL
ncbi:hypothetical protein V6Z11_A12G225700 [Gossypium hirsutum]